MPLDALPASLALWFARRGVRLFFILCARAASWTVARKANAVSPLGGGTVGGTFIWHGRCDRLKLFTVLGSVADHRTCYERQGTPNHNYRSPPQ
jgi:hypothetical protein